MLVQFGLLIIQFLADFLVLFGDIGQGLGEVEQLKQVGGIGQNVDAAAVMEHLHAAHALLEAIPAGVKLRLLLVHFLLLGSDGVLGLTNLGLDIIQLVGDLFHFLLQFGVLGFQLFFLVLGIFQVFLVGRLLVFNVFQFLLELIFLVFQLLLFVVGVSRRGRLENQGRGHHQGEGHGGSLTDVFFHCKRDHVLEFLHRRGQTFRCLRMLVAVPIPHMTKPKATKPMTM